MLACCLGRVAMAETKMQLNLTFMPIEDRLLFRIASGVPGVAMEEYRLWLTRRLVKLLWNALDRMVDISTSMDPRVAPEGRDAIKQFQQSAALSNTDFATPYAYENVTAPLGPNPLLIHKFQVRKGAGSSHILSVEATTGQTVNITLGLQLIHSLRKLLVDIIKQADWDFHPYAIISEDAFYVTDVPKTIN